VTRFFFKPLASGTNTKFKGAVEPNEESMVIMAAERLTEFVTVKGFIGEVLKWVCKVHTFAASGGSNVRAMDLFGNNLVSAFDHETRV
jgi:hypothetical protein